MMYGHQVDRGWSTGGLLLGMLLAAAAGASLGLLFAPREGRDSRRTLVDVAARVKSRLGIASPRPRAIEGRFAEMAPHPEEA
jgi:hypothetical protein